MMMPSFLPISFLVMQNTHVISENTKSTIMSITFSIRKVIGLMVAATPSTIRILKTFDPTTLPTAISNSFFLAATMDVTSSGKDVPTEQMVSPTSVALIPKLVAMVEAESCLLYTSDAADD